MKKLMSIYIDVKQVDDLKKISEETRVPKSVYIREGIDLAIQKYYEEMKTKKWNEEINKKITKE